MPRPLGLAAAALTAQRFADAARIASEAQHGVLEVANGTAELRQGDACTEALAHAGVDCYNDVRWAMQTGVVEHPEWYPGLTASSWESEFQLYLSGLPACSAAQGPPCAAHPCPLPCYQSPTICNARLSMGAMGDWGYSSCHGSEGFSAPMGICVPDGAGGANILTGSRPSSSEAPCPALSGTIRIQHYPDPLCAGEPDHGYTSLMDGMCLRNCCNEDASNCDLGCHANRWTETCHHVASDSECVRQAMWAMTEGITQHPEWYTGLSATSSFLDFQRYLSGLPLCSENGSVPPCYGGAERCPTPCK